MSASEPQTIPFDGVRLRFGSTKSFDDLVDAVLADVGREPVPIDDIAKRSAAGSPMSTRCNPTSAQVVSCCSDSFNHGGWIAKTGIHRKVLRLVIGNPLIAITMMRHDVTAGLFAPVELLSDRRRERHKCADLRRAVVTHGRRTQSAASCGGPGTRRQAGRTGHEGDREARPASRTLRPCRSSRRSVSSRGSVGSSSTTRSTPRAA